MKGIKHICTVLRKYWVLVCVEFIILLMALLGCFQREKLVYGESDIVLGAGSGNGYYQSQFFEVSPGVYQVRAEGIEVQENLMVVNAACEQSFFRTFRCNGMVAYPEQKTVDFEIYVLQNIDTAYVNLQVPQGDAKVGSIEVYRVNWGARILTFLTLVACTGLNMLLYFREGILDGSITKQKQLVVYGLLGGILVAYFPYMTDYFSDAADIAFHWLRIEGLKESLLQANQFPVRVQSYWLYDHGYAVSTFYGDLFLMIPVMFRLIGFTLMDSYKMFVLVMTIATALISYGCFKRCTKHVYSALFGSIFYMLAPYRIYNFYNRGAIGECLAMTLFPLIICGMYILFAEDPKSVEYRHGKWLLVVGLTSILQSHMLSCELVIVGIGLTCIICYKKTFRKETFRELLQAAVLSLLLNMWFWLPLLKMMSCDDYLLENIISQKIQYMGTWYAEIFQIYPNEGGAQSGMFNAEPFHVGVASLIILIVVACVCGYKRVCKNKVTYENPYERSVLFWSLMVVVGWFLSTRYFPWDFVARIPGIKILATALQFPTRMFAIASVFAAVEACYFYLWMERECAEKIPVKENYVRAKRSILYCLLILAFCSSVYHINDIAYVAKPIWLYTAENMGSISVVNGEYLLEDTHVTQYYYHGPRAEEGIKWSQYEKEGTSIRIYVKNEMEKNGYMELPLIGYKGYALECDESDAELPFITDERGEHGDLKIEIPATYEGFINVSYKGFVIYRVAEMISLITMIAVFVVLLYRRKEWKKNIEQY